MRCFFGAANITNNSTGCQVNRTDNTTGPELCREAFGTDHGMYQEFLLILQNISAQRFR